MTYATFISLLRSDVSDFPNRRFESADGDGTTTLFHLKHPKFLESTMTIKIGGATQAASTYTLSPNSGQVVFNTAPASGNENVTFEYQSVNETDADWIDIANQALQYWRRKIWIEFVDVTSLTSVVDQVDYALSTIAADVVHVLNVEVQHSTNADQWQDLSTHGNVIFYKDLQKLHIRPPFKTAGYQLRVRGNRAFVQGSTPAATFEAQTKYQPAIREFCKATYIERRALARLQETSAVAKENTFKDMTETLKVAQQIKQNAETMMKTVRPTKPAMQIPNVNAGIRI